ncbi:hypothetical protein LRP31_18855 [Mesorhizobium mediterraneum]|uniref:Uncharacterized protein n=1 Tax=Mesorhizobium mediterraneum TaxID=43617 RepID=A0AB36RAU8_9HYPH|nr:hypothetical protein [Mesorhizobium mediterraneum]PAQ01548.1 hypothetical protein CIT25_16050 [Mesorhizobium mediterraneum]RWN26413.1 MAG: hypothetical protein EOR96_34230 [Mesorhizobium sp.]WIW51153.1 hypothetical protein LRP31_18855 [Mesorhizobium mediterraneum]
MSTAPLPLCEPIAILDIFVSGVGDMEELSPNLFRVTYYAKQRDTYTGETQLNVVAKFVVTFETLMAMSHATVEKRTVSNESLGLTPSGTIN